MLILKSGTKGVQDYSEKNSVMVSHAIAWAVIIPSELRLFL
ncbi:MAG: hypothetical protein PUE79_00750 [Bacteroidales bacterium]|nr:hypothetical protein [Bacteroidales bacterium]